MSSNVAIVVGVSNYDNLNKLAACESDYQLMLGILQNTGRYADILSLKNPHQANLSHDLAKKIDEWKDIDINEVLFYYSGHGLIDDDGDFRYLPFNYHASSLRSSSLSNSELDNLLRRLRSNLVVKIVDACNSGMSYIKSAASSDWGNSNEGAIFQNAYFFYSSHKNEISQVSSPCSHFTSAFAQCLLGKIDSPALYIDLQREIADLKSFPSNQRPYFANQGKMTEVFCDVTPDIASLIRTSLAICEPATQDLPGQSLSALENDTSQIEAGSGTSLLTQRLRDLDCTYCTEENMQRNLNAFADELEAISFATDAQDLYDLSIRQSSEPPNLSSIRKIGEWVERFGEHFFAKPTYADEIYQDYKKVEYHERPSRFAKSIMGTSLLLQKDKVKIEYQPIEKTRRILAGYELTVNSPCTSFVISFTPKFKALPKITSFIAFIVSRQRLRIFYKSEPHKELNYVDSIILDNSEWSTRECILSGSHEIKKMVKECADDIEAKIVEISQSCVA